MYIDNFILGEKVMFDEQEVNIFVYWNGEKKAFVDPVDIQCNLESYPGGDNIDQLFKAAELGDANAIKEVVSIGRTMFALPEPRLDENDKLIGLSSEGVCKLLLRFVEYTAELKKNIEDTPISVPSTDAQTELPTNVL